MKKEIVFVLIVAIVVLFYVFLASTAKNKKMVEELTKNLATEKEIGEEVAKSLDNLINHFMASLLTRIKTRKMLNGTTKVYYTNEYSYVLNTYDVTDEEIEACKKEIARKMVEDILNGKENVL